MIILQCAAVITPPRIAYLYSVVLKIKTSKTTYQFLQFLTMAFVKPQYSCLLKWHILSWHSLSQDLFLKMMTLLCASCSLVRHYAQKGCSGLTTDG